MTQQIVTLVLLVMFVQADRAAFPQESVASRDKTITKKISAAKTCNTYISFRKGEDAHCLYDPVAENAVALTIFHDPKLKEIKLSIPGSDTILKDSAVHNFKIDQADFYAIHKNRKIIIANTTTGQTGVIRLGKPKSR